MMIRFRFLSLFHRNGDITNTSLFLIGEAVVIAVLIAIGYAPGRG